MNKEIIEVKYSKKILYNMRTINGAFEKERQKLKKYKFNEPLRYRIFKPIIPDGLSKEELKTVIDLAVFAGCLNIILPSTPYIESLKKRASVYGLIVEMLISDTQDHPNPE